MKNLIPKPCTKKLNQNNFCNTCQHQIQDFSKMPTNDLLNVLEHKKPFCGIFSTEQFSLTSQPIYNLIIFSSISLFPTAIKAQTNYNTEIQSEQSIQIVKKKFRLKLEKSELAKETYRLIINGHMVDDSINNNAWTEIEFEIEKDQNINISLHSNLKQEYYFSEFLEKDLPETIVIQRQSFKQKVMIMGKIAYPIKSLSNK